MATKSLSVQANENFLKNEIELLNKEGSRKDQIIKDLQTAISKLQDDLTVCKSSRDNSASAATKASAEVEELKREQNRLQTQIAQLRTKYLDATMEHQLEVKKMQSELDSQRRESERDIKELRSEHMAERKRREAELSSQHEASISSQKSALTHQNDQLSLLVATLRSQVQNLEKTEQQLRSTMSQNDRDLRALRVELKRAQAGTPLITETVLPDPIEKTINGLEKKVDRLKGNVISQIEETSKAISDKDDYKTKCRTLQEELDDANRAKTRAELDKADLERRLGRKIDELEARLAVKTREAKDRDTAVNKAARMKVRLEEKELELTSIQDQLEHMKQELVIAKTKFDAVSSTLQTQLIAERAKVEQLEIKLHASQSQCDHEKKRVHQEMMAKKSLEDQLKKLKENQVQREKDSDKLASRVAKLEKNLRDLERATLKV